MADKVSQCDICAYYYYDDEEDMQMCNMNMDEDDMMRFLSSPHSQCPFFHIYDEYKIVRKQNQRTQGTILCVTGKSATEKAKFQLHI